MIGDGAEKREPASILDVGRHCIVAIVLRAGTSDVMKAPIHSHSIASCAYKHLKTDALVSRHANFTVRYTVEKSCLAAIDDAETTVPFTAPVMRCRSTSNALADPHRRRLGRLDGNAQPFRRLTHALVEAQQS
jgi:hypothetical protein